MEDCIEHHPTQQPRHNEEYGRLQSIPKKVWSPFYLEFRQARIAIQPTYKHTCIYVYDNRCQTLTFTFFGRYTQFEIYCTQSSFGDELASQLTVRFIMSVAQPKRRCSVTMCLAGSFGKRYMAIRCLPSSFVSEVFVGVKLHFIVNCTVQGYVSLCTYLKLTIQKLTDCQCLTI